LLGIKRVAKLHGVCFEPKAGALNKQKRGTRSVLCIFQRLFAFERRAEQRFVPEGGARPGPLASPSRERGVPRPVRRTLKRPLSGPPSKRALVLCSAAQLMWRLFAVSFARLSFGGRLIRRDGLVMGWLTFRSFLLNIVLVNIRECWTVAVEICLTSVLLC